MEIMLNELALSVTPLDSSWYATSHPADATTCEAKERHIANMFWWDVLRSPVIQRIEPASNPRHPDILWRFYIPVGSWNSRHKCCSHRTIVPALNKFQREIVRRFNGLIASLARFRDALCETRLSDVWCSDARVPWLPCTSPSHQGKLT